MIEICSKKWTLVLFCLVKSHSCQVSEILLVKSVEEKSSYFALISQTVGKYFFPTVSHFLYHKVWGKKFSPHVGKKFFPTVSNFFIKKCGEKNFPHMWGKIFSPQLSNFSHLYTAIVFFSHNLCNFMLCKLSLSQPECH